MVDYTDAELKNREFVLKVIQAWAEARYRIATGITLVNGVVLATTVTLMKDKGNVEPYITALDHSVSGFSAGIFAIALVWLLSEHVFDRLVKGESDLHAKQVMSALPSILYIALIGASLVGFIAATGFFQGYTRAWYEHSQKK